MDKLICPLCGKNFKDLLGHLVIAHQISNMNHLKQEIEEKERAEAKRAEFRKYVDELENKVKKGEISRIVYREFISKWIEEHQ